MTNSLVNPSVEAVGENGFSARLVRFIESECGAGTGMPADFKPRSSGGGRS